MAAWTIEARDGAVLVTMRSNPVNKQDEAFFAEMAQALDELDAEYPGVPAVLTGSGKVFSAGLDFESTFAMFETATADGLVAWFARYMALFGRLIASPRPTVAAVNGHAFAGGAILALATDVRLGCEGGGQVALNEVAIGIPMPAGLTELVRHRLGDRTASEWVLWGRRYPAEEARDAGFFERLVPPGELVEAALERARSLPRESLPAFVASKRTLVEPLLSRMGEAALRYDRSSMEVLLSPEGVAARRAAKERLAASKKG